MLNNKLKRLKNSRGLNFYGYHYLSIVQCYYHDICFFFIYNIITSLKMVYSGLTMTKKRVEISPLNRTALLLKLISGVSFDCPLLRSPFHFAASPGKVHVGIRKSCDALHSCIFNCIFHKEAFRFKYLSIDNNVE